MARKRYTTDEIIKHLRTLEIERANGASMDQAAKKIGVSPITLSRWLAEFGGLRVEQAKKLKDLEKENQRLKRLLANAELDKSILKEALEGNY
jgi:transposase-like protein